MRDPVDRLPHHALRLLGIILFVLAGLGLGYNIVSLLTPFPPDPSTPYFRQALYSMTAICVACYVALVFIAVQFIRLGTSWFRAFVGVIVFEVVYFFGIGTFSFSAFLWSPELALSVGAAFGVANGGLMFQFIILFPIWGPLWGRWATKAIGTPPARPDSVYPEPEIDQLSDWGWAVVNFAVMFALMLLLLGLVTACLSSESVLFYAMPWSAIAFVLSSGNAIRSVSYRRLRRKRGIEALRRDRRAKGLCPRCEYSLAGNTSGVCPECGEVVDPGGGEKGCAPSNLGGRQEVRGDTRGHELFDGGPGRG